MIKKYILAGLLILFPVSAFADGGLPLWINTIQTVAATSGIKGLGYPLSSSVITLICLILIIFCETLLVALQKTPNLLGTECFSVRATLLHVFDCAQTASLKSKLGPPVCRRIFI